MNLFSEAVALLAFSQLMLLGIYFAVRYEGSLARLISLYSLCLGAYTLVSISFIAGNPVSFYVLFRLATMAPFVLWVIAYMLFVDGGRIHFSVWFAIAYFLVARGLGMGLSYFYPSILQPDINWLAIQVIPQLLMLCFSAHSIYLAINGYKNDLVEQRRQLRLVFIVCMGTLLVAIVGSDFIILFQRFTNSTWLTGLQFNTAPLVSLYIFFLATLFIITVFRLSNEAHTLIASEASHGKNSATLLEKNTTVKPELLERIRVLMEADRFYARTGLTISDLADALSMQEYRVRHLINQQLQYRNFNQFLNNYRIEDAARKLRDKENSISWIALEVGYASLSVFNKAFRERFDMTPTMYRNTPAHTKDLDKAD
ncbi:MAG: AraC-like DNA-binding protein [Paracoccaceae bacterium]|jgi:AraC-like DNA-binding protein